MKIKTQLRKKGVSFFRVAGIFSGTIVYSIRGYSQFLGRLKTAKKKISNKVKVCSIKAVVPLQKRNAPQIERDALLAELKKARSQAKVAKVVASTLEAYLVSVASKLMKLRIRAEKSVRNASVQKEGETPREETLELMDKYPTEEETQEPAPLVVEEEQQINKEFDMVTAPAETQEDSEHFEVENRRGEPEQDAEPEFETDDKVFLAREVTPEEVESALFSSAVEKVIFFSAFSDMASTKDEITRTEAAKAIGSIQHDLSIRVLISHLSGEKSAVIRQECVNALATQARPEAVQAVETVLTDPDAMVRLAAVRAMYSLAGLKSADALTRMLTDVNEDVRHRAVACLGWLGHEPLAERLTPLLLDSSPIVRRATVDALGNLKSLSVVEQVIELLDDTEKAVQKAAFQALHTITGKQMVSVFPEKENEHQILVARWRAWQQEENSLNGGR